MSLEESEAHGIRREIYKLSKAGKEIPEWLRNACKDGDVDDIIEKAKGDIN